LLIPMAASRASAKQRRQPTSFIDAVGLRRIQVYSKHHPPLPNTIPWRGRYRAARLAKENACAMEAAHMLLRKSFARLGVAS